MFTIHYIKKQFKLSLLSCSQSSTDTDRVKYNTKKYTFWLLSCNLLHKTSEDWNMKGKWQSLVSQNRTIAQQESGLLIMSMISYRIKRHEVLLPIYDNYYSCFLFVCFHITFQFPYFFLFLVPFMWFIWVTLKT